MAQLIYPKITASIVSEGGNISTQAQKILLVGPIDLTPVTGGTGTPLVVYENISLSDAYLYFGTHSLLSSAIYTIYKDIYPQTSGSTITPQIDAIGVGEGVSSVASQANVSFTGVATSDSFFTVIVGSQLKHSYSLQVSVGDTAYDIATAFAPIINSDTYAPFVATNTTVGSTENLFVTSVHKGTIGNNFSIEFVGYIPGITLGLVGFAGGSIDPSTTSIFNTVQNIRYQTVVTPSEWGRAYVNSFLYPRFNTNQNSIMDGESIITVTDTFANMEAYATSGDGVTNSQVMTTFSNVFVNEDNYVGGSIIEFNLVISAQIAAVRALRLTINANITNFIIANLVGTTDAVGGPPIASLPYFNTRGFVLPTIDPQYELTSEEIDEAESNCLSVIGNSPNRLYIQLGEVVTSYLHDIYNNPDNTLKYLNYVDTFSVIREIYRNTLLFLYGQARLVNPNGATGGGRSVASEQTIRADIISIYSTLAGNDYLLTQGDQNSIDTFKNSISIVRDSTNRGFNISMFVPIVGQLEQLNITFIFNTNA